MIIKKQQLIAEMMKIYKTCTALLVPYSVRKKDELEK